MEVEAAGAPGPAQEVRVPVRAGSGREAVQGLTVPVEKAL